MKVILATDGSEHAQEAASLLAHLPHTDKLELTVLFISNAPNLRGSMNDAELIRRILEADQARAKSIFENLKQIFDGANASLELVVSEGHVGATIVHEADSRMCDLIVLGAVGHSAFERMLGSISDFVATHAKCSVLVVRPTGLGKRNRPIDLCIAFDESDASSQSIEQLSHFGWGVKSKLEILSVITIPFVYSDIPLEFDFAKAMSTRKVLVDKAAVRLKELSPNVESHVVEANHVGDGLVQFAKKAGSDIIVMGSTGKGLLERFLLGSVSRHVLRHANCSVWIARKRKG
jgi:nucleotide-binding universal stress UspA family protein